MTFRRHGHYGSARPLTIGFVAIGLLIGGVTFWGASTEIAGAVVASGAVTVENNRQIVQHADGGVVGAIFARDGDLVRAGDTLVRLDGVELTSDLAVTDTELIEIRARQARLEAERDGRDKIEFPASLTFGTKGGADASAQVGGQQALFDARHDTRRREDAQIGERIRQIRNQILGTEALLAALATEGALIDIERANHETLLSKGLIQAQRVLSLRRDAARLEGDIGRLRSEVARLRAEITALEIERLKQATTRREDAIAALGDLRLREMELVERRGVIDRKLAHLDIRAPVDGIVHGSTIFAERSVLTAAETLLFIVPQDRPLVISARVAARDIDQVHIGQPATLRFTAFNQRLTPEVSGRVTKVSADVFYDAPDGASFYQVELSPLDDAITGFDKSTLVPGMPVEAFLRTSNRTPLSYLTRPLTDYFARAFRES